MKRVIIIGASYAGLYAAKKFINNNDVEVLLFDKSNYHYIQVESYGFVATRYDISDVTINVNDYIKNLDKNITFYKREIESFNSDLKQITTTNNEIYEYDYLIIATGSITNFPTQVPNIQNYSNGIKNLQKASDVKQTFDSIINEVVWKQKNKKNKTYNIVIGGAGLSGVEIASEMSSILKDSNNYSNINIIIVDGMKTVLPNMDERLITSCHKRLEELGIKVYLGSFIKDVDEKKIYLTNETEIEYDYFVFTGGIKAITLNSPTTYEVNKLNQYIVNDCLQLKDEKDVFAVGDAAQIMSKGKYLAPTAQIAIQAGEYVSSYIQNEINKKENQIFEAQLNGVLISLGGNYAIGLVYDKFFITGYIAHKLKKYVTRSHKRKFI